MTGGNLKEAPLALTRVLVAKLVGDRPAYGAGIVYLPLGGRLVDRPRRSEDPRLARANDIESTAAEVAMAGLTGGRAGRASNDPTGAAAGGSPSPGDARPAHDSQPERARCGCPSIIIARVQRGGTCGRGGCPYGGDF